MGHVHQLYDLTVGAFIEHEQRLLLVFHKKLNVWINIGGHVELNEDPEMALWREIFEETGLQQQNLQLIDLSRERPDETNTGVKMLPIPFDLTVYFAGDSLTHQHIDLAYMMKSDTDKITCNPHESSRFNWFTLEQLEELKDELFPNVYAQCLFALRKLSRMKLKKKEDMVLSPAERVN